MPIAALAIPAIIGAGASIAGGVMANKGAKAQADSVTNASNASIAEQRRQYDLNRQDLAPWMSSGSAANQKLAYLLGVGPQYSFGESPSGTASQTSTQNPQPLSGYNSGTSDRMFPGPQTSANYNPYNSTASQGPNYKPNSNPVGAPAASSTSPNFDPQGGYGSLLSDFTPGDLQNEPGYQFELGQGAQALQRSAAAKGQLFSGGTLKALTQYNNDFAGTKYNEAFNRFNTNKLNRYNMLSGLSSGGQQVSTNLANLGQQSANNISNNIMSTGEQVGNARASGYAATGAAINGVANAGLGAYYLGKLK